VEGIPVVEDNPEGDTHNTPGVALLRDNLAVGVQVAERQVAAGLGSTPVAEGKREYWAAQGRSQLVHRGCIPQAWACRGCKASACY